MPRGLDTASLLQGWQKLPKDWYSIYQWPRTKAVGYTEQIAEWIIAAFDTIRLSSEGLRERSFRVQEHRGQIDLGTGIEQLTEKRVVQATFNRLHVSLLGKIIDYEVPLKETDDVSHGDIDLLCLQGETLFAVEAKHPKAAESVWKAILQAFV